MASTLSYLASLLPDLPSIPLPSLPQNIQRRLLSFLLRRSIGRFVKDGLDADAIEADLGRGHVTVQSLELAEEAISPLLDGLPVTFEAGTIGLIAAQVSWPLSLSSSFAVEVDDVAVTLRLTQADPMESSTSTLSASTNSVASNAGTGNEGTEDLLADSIISIAVASEFVKEELDPVEDAALRESLHLAESSTSDFSIPGAFGTAPRPPLSRRESEQEDIAEVNMLAGLIDRILSRLVIKARQIRITFIVGDATAQSETAVKFSVDEIEYATQQNTTSQAAAPQATQVESGELTTRLVRISSPTLRLRTPSKSPASSRRSSGDSTASGQSSSSDDTSTDANMLMSQSVADLRTSFVSATSGGASMYASAFGYAVQSRSQQFKSEEDVTASPFVDPDAILEPLETAAIAKEWRTVLSFGSEPISITLSTKHADSSGAKVDAEPTERPKRRRPELNIQSSVVGPVSLLISPRQIECLMRILTALPASDHRSVAPTNPPKASGPFSFAVSVKAVNCVLIYDTRSEMSHAEADAFWSHPSTFAPSLNHLRLRIEGLGVWLVRLRDEPHRTVFPVRSFSLIEHTRLAAGDAMRPLPLIVTDANLSKQYELGGRDDPLPVFDSHDWLRDRSAESRGWKVKLQTKVRVGERESSPAPSRTTPALTMTIENDRSHLEVSPLHVFIDLTIVQRLLPLVDLITHTMPKRLSTASAHLSQSRTQRTPRPATPLSPRRVLSDLSLEAEAKPYSAPASGFSLSCALLRVEIRCPPPRHHESTETSVIPASVRSAIVVADLHDIQLTLRDASHVVDGPTKLTWTRMLLACAPDGSAKATTFASLATLMPDRDEGAAAQAQPVCITITSLPIVDLEDSNMTSAPIDIRGRQASQTIDVALPLLRVSLDKVALDSLQLFADDLTQWSAAVADGLERSSDSFDRTPDAKMIGSRFFSAKTYSRPRAVGSDSSDSGALDAADSSKIVLNIIDAVIDLHVPRMSPATGLPPRQVRLLASDVVATVVTPSSGKSDLRLQASVGDISVRHDNLSSPIACRTLPRSLTRQSAPIVLVAFTSAVDPDTRLKESKIDVTLADLTCNLTADLDWIEEVAAFAKAPEGAFEAVVPNELTRLRLRLADVSVYLSAPNTSARVVISVEDMRVSTNIMPDLPRTSIILIPSNVRLLASGGSGDEPEANSTDRPPPQAGHMHWKSQGLVELLCWRRAQVEIRQGNGLVLPDHELLLNDSLLELQLCADSLSAVTDFATDFTNSMTIKTGSSAARSASSSRRLATRKTSSDLLSSVDSAAFQRASPVDDYPEALDDDVPTNLAYLTEALQQDVSSPVAPQIEADRAGQIISDVDGETIRLLDSEGLHIIEDYFNVPRLDPARDVIEPASVLRCRVSRCDVTVRLYEGYDWHRTRKAIEEESKRIRKRLEKIRQLLAAGQTADASAEDASVLMFGSVQLGLPAGASDLPTQQLLAAIDEELQERGGDDDTASTASEWRSEATVVADASKARPPQKASTKPRRSLRRSRSAAVDVNLRGLDLSFDTYPSSHPISSKLRLNVTTVDVVDNMRSSTWHKFLTELRPNEGGIVRASSEPMAKIELSRLRSEHKASAASPDDIVLKVKVCPLRLYIDQDALEFLKAFGAFKSDSQPAAPAQSSAGEEPFFRRVEIMPVKIKLDYKPKRVDYQALRRGKTAELMNFFHFEGSEMTLRHLVVRGVSGTARLSDLVQDIWTPDVKANQLADVVSGIGPVRSVVNVGSGVANLVLLPIEQYRRDGRIARGLQRGATTFARQTTLEALNVGARLATGTQVILEQAEAVLGGRMSAPLSTEALQIATDDENIDFSSVPLDPADAELISRYAEQPGDLREGVESAYKSLGQNFRSAAQTILAVPMEVYERSGQEGPVRAVVRAVPIAVLKPMIGASEAVSKALFGLRNSLDPDAQAAAADKYKQASTAPSNSHPSTSSSPAP